MGTLRKGMMAAVLAVAVVVVAAPAQALPVTQYLVWEDINGDNVKDVVIGSISAYSGAISGASNYNFFSASGHPTNGPTPVAYESKLWLYDGSDGLSLGMIHNIDEGGNVYWNHIQWEMKVTGTASSIKLVDDNTPENRGEVGIVKTGTDYDVGWSYNLNTDGAVIGDLTGFNWEIMIDPGIFGDIQTWDIYSGGGGSINLWNNPTGVPSLAVGQDYALPSAANTIFITPDPIPEPGTLMLFGFGLAAGARKLGRKFGKKS